MYYDDIYMEDMEPATRVSEYCARILALCEEDPYLSEELEKEGERFFTAKPETYYSTSEERESAELRFMDYFIFSYTSSHYGKTPLEVFLAKKSSELTREEKEIYSGFKFHIYSGFEILKVAIGSHFIAKDLFSNKVYKIRENRGTYYLEEGDFIVARILSYGKDYALSHIGVFLPKEASYLPKREWRRISKKEKEKTNPLVIEKILYQGEKRRKREDNLQMVEKKLRRKLNKYLGKKAISIKQLRKKINETTDPLEVMKEITRKINFPTTEEFIEFQELFNLFWNLSPRDEFGGKSPEEKTKEGMGPKEKQLISDLTRYMSSEIDPEKFSSQEELERKVEEYKNRWLSEPQPELNGKTPWEIILEERKKLGIPRKDFSITVSVTPTYPQPGIKSRLNEITPKDTPFAEDLEVFVNYLENNKIKVTPKNRWVPFKHLKLIEQNFKHKDSFTFMGKEEKRGEEPRKRYVNFIDKICRAKGLIRIDRKGWIIVNKARVRKFKEKSYGEKLFELFRSWVEDVDWKDLQATDFRDYYCEMYQKDFRAPLYHLHRLKVNEKTTPEEIVRKLYASKIKMIEEQEGLFHSLTIGLKSILLDYLNWLGIIDTEGVELIEGSGIFSIKKFWITPAGKRLMNQIVIHFIQKGEIKVK